MTCLWVHRYPILEPCPKVLRHGWPWAPSDPPWAAQHPDSGGTSNPRVAGELMHLRPTATGDGFKMIQKLSTKVWEHVGTSASSCDTLLGSVVFLGSQPYMRNMHFNIKVIWTFWKSIWAFWASYRRTSICFPKFPMGFEDSARMRPGGDGMQQKALQSFQVESLRQARRHSALPDRDSDQRSISQFTDFLVYNII